jgi:hypothetical protein
MRPVRQLKQFLLLEIDQGRGDRKRSRKASARAYGAVLLRTRRGTSIQDTDLNSILPHHDCIESYAGAREQLGQCLVKSKHPMQPLLNGHAFVHPRRRAASDEWLGFQ